MIYVDLRPSGRALVDGERERERERERGIQISQIQISYELKPNVVIWFDLFCPVSGHAAGLYLRPRHLS